VHDHKTWARASVVDGKSVLLWWLRVLDGAT
jgi:hypothetical protein